LFPAVGRVLRGAGRDQVQLQGRVRPGPLAQQTQISRPGEPSLESPFNIITVHSIYLFNKNGTTLFQPGKFCSMTNKNTVA
jgi:hypothetical protein